MASKNDVIIELEVLSEKLCIKEYKLINEIHKIEESMKARSYKRKEILFRELKNVHVNLTNIEEKVINDLKLDAFDFLHDAKNLSDEVTNFHDAVENALDFKRSWRSDFLLLKEKVDKLKSDEIISCLDISLQVEQGSLNAGFKDVLQYISFEMPAQKYKKTVAKDVKIVDKFHKLDELYERVLDDETEYVSNYVMQCFKV